VRAIVDADGSAVNARDSGLKADAVVASGNIGGSTRVEKIGDAVIVTTSNKN